jgi:hemolysin activation/secretion protein
MRYKISPRVAAAAFSAALLSPQALAAETVHFDIIRFEVSGNFLLDTNALAALVAPYSGTSRVYGDIQKALEAVEGAYRERGYGAVQVTVPEQELTQGVVRLDVTEAKVGKIIVTGNLHFDEDNILASLPGLKLGETPNARRLSESVQLANESPAKKIDVILGIGEKDGDLEARVEVKDEKPWAVFLSSDNTGTRDTGNDRTGVTLQYANLGNRDQAATIAYTSSVDRPQSTKVYSLSYRLPIYAWGDSVDLIVGQSDVAAATSDTVAGPLQFSGSGMVYALRYNLMLPRRGEYSHRVVLGVDQREYDNTCALDGQAVCGSGGADVTVRPLSLAYAGQLDSPGSSSSVSLSVAGNLTGGPNSRAADFSASRVDAGPHYAVFRGGLSHSQSVGNDWQVRGAISLQYSNDALVSGEQLGLVGSTAVRGFQERVVTADKGYFGTVEIYTPDLAPLFGNSGNLRLLGFYDFAHGSYNKTAPGIYANEGVSSLGVGLRYALGRSVSLRADLARVVDGGPNNTAAEKPVYVGVVIGF